jgi:glutaredoxin/glutathione-dependent peroxiredoxin
MRRSATINPGPGPAERNLPMPLAIGDRLPDATFVEITEDGPREVTTAGVFGGRRVMLVALPGPYTPTCDRLHLPSFVRTAPAFAAEGVDEIVCLAVTDGWVMRHWGEATGATAAGIRMLADASGAFTRAIGMAFDAPAVGFYGRSVRYAAFVEDGVVTLLSVEEGRGVCDMTAGETMLEALVAAKPQTLA